MAFRTELEAMRARAEAAEALLAEHAKKAARADHADARLEEAKRIARAAATQRGVRSGRAFAVGLVAGSLASVLLAFVTFERAPEPVSSVAAEPPAVDDRMRGEVGSLGTLVLLHGDVGAVLLTRGPAPVTAGARCSYVPSATSQCIGGIVCDGMQIHAFGCSPAAPTSVTSGTRSIVVVEPTAGWSVAIAP